MAKKVLIISAFKISTAPNIDRYNINYASMAVIIHFYIHIVNWMKLNMLSYIIK